MHEKSTAEFIDSRVFNIARPEMSFGDCAKSKALWKDYELYCYYRFCTVSYLTTRFNQGHLSEREMDLLISTASTRQGVKEIAIQVIAGIGMFKIDLEQIKLEEKITTH